VFQELNLHGSNITNSKRVFPQESEFLIINNLQTIRTTQDFDFDQFH